MTEDRNHTEAGSSAGGSNGGRDWSACATPESEERRVERRVSDKAAQALGFGAAGSRVARGVEFGRVLAMEGALCCMVDASACCRTPGVRRGGRCGEPIWATSRPNQTLGQK